MPNIPRTARMRQRRLTALTNPLLVPGGRAQTVSRTGGGYSAPGMGDWTPRRINFREEGRQRNLIADRSSDLVANDPHACSLIEAISINTVGPGLWPQSKPNWKRLALQGTLFISRLRLNRQDFSAA